LQRLSIVVQVFRIIDYFSINAAKMSTAGSNYSDYGDTLVVAIMSRFLFTGTPLMMLSFLPAKVGLFMHMATHAALSSLPCGK